MKPYANLNGKAHWSIFWGDKVPKRVKKLFKKSARKNKSNEIESCVVENCTTCKHNVIYRCTVGTYLAEQGLGGICYDGNLWEPKENTICQ